MRVLFYKEIIKINEIDCKSFDPVWVSSKILILSQKENFFCA